jgi:hypothetical protein
MSSKGYLLGVVVAASSGLCGCVLQGERHENRLMNEMCALAEEAPKKLECTEKKVTYTTPLENDAGEIVATEVEVSDEGKRVEPAPTTVTPTWRLDYDCVVEQTRLRNLCGPELDAVNRCVLDALELKLEEEAKKAAETAKDETDGEVEEAAFEGVFQCFAATATFTDPGQVDEDGVELQITRTSHPGWVLITEDMRTADPENPDHVDCASEIADLAVCSAGR